MKLDDFIYRRSHPFLKAGKKSPSIFRTLFDPLEPMDFFDDDDIRVFVYPEKETRREDLEILGQDLYTGFMGHIQETGSNGKGPRKKRFAKRS